jgi:hypothetical protein
MRCKTSKGWQGLAGAGAVSSGRMQGFSYEEIGYQRISKRGLSFSSFHFTRQQAVA